MAITVQSTSDSKEAVNAAMGDLASKEKVVEPKEAKQPVEQTESDETEAVEPDEEVEATEPEESESETTDDETEEATDTELDEPKQKKKGGFQKRIDKLSKKASALEQEKDYWRDQALRNQKPDEKAAPVETKPDFSKRPNANDFDSHDAYIEAVTDWKVEQKLSGERQKQRDDTIKIAEQQKLENHRERVTKFAESHDDWDDVIEAVGKTQLSLTVQEAILNSSQGPELMYELAKNPKELKRICSLSPVAAAMELGKIEGRVGSPDKESKTKKQTTNAPAPVKPVRTKGTAISRNIEDPNVSQREFERMRNEQIKQRSRY